MSIEIAALRARIENASETLGQLWPLDGFNASNPLTGFEDRPFDEAVQHAGALFGGRGYPSAQVFRDAWNDGAIDPDVLTRTLETAGIHDAPDALLDRMDDAPAVQPHRESVDRVNRAMVKWLSAFLDQGQASWPLPNRENGFYAAWRILAPYDAALPGVRSASDLPETKVDALREALRDHPESTWEDLFAHHFAALPGWSSFIKRRDQAKHDAWANACPMTLGDYLAVRLTATIAMGEDVRGVLPDQPAKSETDTPRLASLWLKAWEETYRTRLLDDLGAAATDESTHAPDADRTSEERPDAQLVFCIDVRSERIRRHLEAIGAYETFGYAGFFGIPMLHEGHDGLAVKACPPILDPKHYVADRVAHRRRDEAERYDAWTRLVQAGSKLVKTLKDNVAAAFGFVEGSGGLFGAAMAVRTLSPSTLFRSEAALDERVSRPDAFCKPDFDTGRKGKVDGAAGTLPTGLTLDAQVLYAESAFRLMGWPETFAPLVVFNGHGSQTPNNPYKSSLDCGACAGHAGGPNARVLATICNDADVRNRLRERGINVPDDTVFIAGEHNTTTDGVALFANEDDLKSETARDAFTQLRSDLREAQHRTASERVGTMNALNASAPVDEVQRRAGDWAETRPEWGLAGNAAFIVGHRDLTADLNLEGRCFLHSYDWRGDDDGTALETILSGPLVVGEWISMQYYFSTVDNAVYGSGSKVTHNVVGTMAIMQGNGGDLMTGLPLQSLQSSDTRLFHAPLRLLAVVEAPRKRVDALLNRQASLKRLFDHEWIALAVVDPTSGSVVRYEPGGTWVDATVSDVVPA